MPRRKSASRLKTLCAETLIRNLNTLQHEARYLPKSLINDLYDTWFERHSYSALRKVDSVDSPPPFPVDLLCHSRTEIMDLTLDYYYFDEPIDKVVDKANRFCKNLKELYLENINFINSITINNPHIMTMTLDGSRCADQHLLIIGKHCPQLQSLSLRSCHHVTDYGIPFLPEKLIELDLPSHITPEGQLKALDRLLRLKVLHYSFGWDDVLETYAMSLADGAIGNRTYHIEKMSINLHRPTIYDIPSTVRTLFPKLRKITFWSNGEYIDSSRVTTFLEAINCDLLTFLYVNVSVDFIQIAGCLCPMLKVLHINFGLEKQKINDRYLTKPQHIPFKFLSKLYIDDRNVKLSTDDLKSLLANCQHLEKLGFSHFQWLSDQVVNDILAMNPLQCLKFVTFIQCGPFTVEALVTFLKSTPSLMAMKVCDCDHLSPEDRVFTFNLIKEMNWDLNLNFPF